MKKGERIIWMDLGRIVSIYLVIVVHTLKSPSVISRLGVPLFVMFSGAMLLPKSESYTDFWNKRLLRLLRPWMFWALVITCFGIFVKKSAFGSFLGFLRFNFVQIWFVPMLFGLYLLTPALRILIKFAKPVDLWCLAGLWYLTISVWPYFRNTAAFPLVSDNGLVRQVVQFSGYYLLGFLLIRQNIRRKKINLILIVLVLLITGIAGKANPEFLNYLAPGIILLSAGTFGLLSNFNNYFQKRISGKSAGILAAVSKTSLGIYFVHPLIFALIPLNIYFDGWVSAILLFGMSLVIILLLQRIPGLKRWVV